MRLYSVIILSFAVLSNNCFAQTQVCILDEIFVWTTQDSIHTQLILHNNTDAPINGVVKQSINCSDGEPFEKIGPNDFKIAPNQTITVELSGTVLKPKLWWPESPYLHQVQTQISVGDKDFILDSRKLGFRTFEVRGSHFYLNGKPYYLRALSQIPPGRVYDSNGNKAPEVWNDEAFVKKFFAKMKELNINAGRIGDNELWVKYADEMGILNVAGSYSGAGERDIKVMEHNKKQFTPIIKKLRNHTSTAIYTLANEIKWENNASFLPLAEYNYVFAKQLDPTRPLIGNAGFGGGKASDIEDIHDYRGWYGNVITSVDDFDGGFYHIGQGTNKPITFTECVGAYTGLSGGFLMSSNKSLSGALRTVGDGAEFAADSLWYQAVITKEMMEAMRRARGMENRICGAFPFSDYWFWDVPNRDFRAKPAVDTLKITYSPVLLSLHCWSRHAFAGEIIKGTIYIVNDDVMFGDIKDATVTVSLIQNEKVLVAKDFHIDYVEYYGTARLPLELRVPANVDAGRAKLLLKLNKPTANCNANEVELFIAPKSWVLVNEKNVFALYDPSGKTELLLKNMGINFRHISRFDSLDVNIPLVVGMNGVDKALISDSENFWRFVEKGGRVLVLEQHPGPTESLLMLPEDTALVEYSELFVNVERQLLSHDLRHRDFFLWNNISQNSNDCFPVKFSFDIKPAALEHSAILANCGHHLQYPVVMEYFKGDGSVIFSQLECISRANSDPVAAKVLTNLLEYLASNEHSFAPQVGWEVRFADFNSENSIFAAPLKQGISVNSHNYGRVSYKSYDWPDGRRVVGEQKLVRMGYIAPVKLDKTGKGFFFLTPPKEAKTFTITVKNPVEIPLWFLLYLNDGQVGEKIIIKPETTIEVGPWPIPSSHGEAMKITLEVPIDVEALGSEAQGMSKEGEKRKVIQELVFTKMNFAK